MEQIVQALNNPLMLPIWFSIICGIIIGIQREIKHKDAGLKTTIFISLGAAVFAYLGDNLSGTYDKSRVLAQIVSGIGFIGGGVIIFDKDKIRGLTSAAIMWMTAGIGAMCGLSLFYEAVMCSITIICVEVLFDRIKRIIRGKRNGS